MAGFLGGMVGVWDHLFNRDEAQEMRDEYNRDFFHLQKSEFAGFGAEVAATPAGQAFIAQAMTLAPRLKGGADADPDRPVLLSELFELEMYLLRAMPEDALRAKVWSARETYAKLVGKDIYAAYEASKPPDPRDLKTTTEQVRNDLIDIVKGKHWWYVNAIVMEHGMRRHRLTLRKWLLVGLVLVLVFNLGVFMHATAAWGNPDHGVYGRAMSAIFLAVYAGILGATISIMRRVKEAADVPLSDTDPVIRLSTIVNGNVGIQLSIMVGATFALVLYFLFVSGVAGQIFMPTVLPQFQSACISSGKCESTLQTFFGLIPDNAKDLGQLLVWCFIAGFAEKFVPDILDKLARSSQNKPDEAPAPRPPTDPKANGDDRDGGPAQRAGDGPSGAGRQAGAIDGANATGTSGAAGRTDKRTAGQQDGDTGAEAAHGAGKDETGAGIAVAAVAEGDQGQLAGTGAKAGPASDVGFGTDAVGTSIEVSATEQPVVSGATAAPDTDTLKPTEADADQGGNGAPGKTGGNPD